VKEPATADVKPDDPASTLPPSSQPPPSDAKEDVSAVEKSAMEETASVVDEKASGTNRGWSGGCELTV
jgi:hypothetical protein